MTTVQSYSFTVLYHCTSFNKVHNKGNMTSQCWLSWEHTRPKNGQREKGRRKGGVRETWYWMK
jgi:hypothetical protein